MNLNQVKSLFTATDFERGMEYYRKGRVTDMQCTKAGPETNDTRGCVAHPFRALIYHITNPPWCQGGFSIFFVQNSRTFAPGFGPFAESRRSFFPPCAGHQQDQHRIEFQPPQQHIDAQYDLRKRREKREVPRRAAQPEAGADIIECRKDSRQRR